MYLLQHTPLKKKATLSNRTLLKTRLKHLFYNNYTRNEVNIWVQKVVNYVKTVLKVNFLDVVRVKNRAKDGRVSVSGDNSTAVKTQKRVS